MLITKLQGGLGNQIFQWAIAKNLSLLHESEFFLNTKFFDLTIQGITPRSFSLNKFPNLKYLVKNDMHVLERSYIVSDYIIDNNGIHYVSNCLKNNRNIILDGYFQNEMFFYQSKQEIINCLKPKEEVLQQLLKKYPSLNGEINISLHIRRTDYVSSNGYHPVQPISYYNSALDMVGKYDKIFIFSDDIEWCKNNLKYDNMVFVEDNDDVEDMWLMSLCTHNIVANSSFSWWGAYLNQKKDSKKIAPKQWYGFSAKNDIIPQNWIKI